MTVFTREFPVSLYLNYIQGKDPNSDAEKVDLKSSEVERMYFSGSNIDLSNGIKEAIVLSLPIASLCHEQCKGLCPVCGVNKNKKQCKCKVEGTEAFIPVPTMPRTRKKRSKKP